MRPVPSRNHHWAVLALVVIAGGNTVLSFRQRNISGDQANMLAEVYKTREPGLYPRDGVFADAGPGAPWRARLPSWRWALGTAMRIGGEPDPLNGFRLLGAAAATGYLLFMYLLLYRQTRSTGIAFLVAVVSTAIFSTKRPAWGVGPIFAVTPATMVVAFTPLAVTLFVHSHRKWIVPGVFLLVGLLGNIHLSSAANLAVVLLAALVALGRARPSAWARAAACAPAALIGAAPALLYYSRTVRAAAPQTPHLPVAEVAGMLKLGRIDVLYPSVVTEFLRWLPMAAVLAIPAAIILFRAGRYRIRQQAVWFWLLGGALAVALGAQGLSQLVGRLRGTPPPVIEFFGALRLAMLPLYVFFAQAAVHLYRQTRQHPLLIRAGLVVFAVVYLGSSFNTRALRHMVRDRVAALAEADGDGEPARPGTNGDRPSDGPPAGVPDEGDRHEELAALAAWLGRDGNTPRDALVITEEEGVRAYGRRSVLCCPGDVRYLYHLAPGRLEDWAECLRRQRALLKPPESIRADPANIGEFADGLAPPAGDGTGPVYVLLPTEKAPSAPGRLVEVRAPEGLWGRRWRLYRLLGPEPADARD